MGLPTPATTGCPHPWSGALPYGMIEHMFDPEPTRRTAELHRAPSSTALPPMVRSRDVLPAESGRCGPVWEALPPPPGRCATDEEIWEHDLGLASIAAELEGTFDEAVVSGIAHLDGCPELAGWLAATEISALGEYDVVEVVAGFERVASWAKARAAEAAAHLSRRPAMNPYWPTYAGKVTDPCTASTELSLRLGVSRQAAGRLVATGRALDGTLSETADALRRGAIDWPKALVITESLGEVPWQVALEVEARVLPAAPGRTPAQLRRDLERALAEVDPQDAQERHGRAVQRRRVERPRVLPDGMASVRAIIPAEAAARLDATLQGAAVSARAGGDSRSVDQLRADALDAMADVAWRTARIGEGTPNSLRVGPVAGRRSQVMVTVGIGTLLGLRGVPAQASRGSGIVRLRPAFGGDLMNGPQGTSQDGGRRCPCQRRRLWSSRSHARLVIVAAQLAALMTKGKPAVSCRSTTSASRP